ALRRYARALTRNTELADDLVQDTLVRARSEEHTSELQSLTNLVCRLLLEKKKNNARNARQKEVRGEAGACRAKGNKDDGQRRVHACMRLTTVTCQDRRRRTQHIAT